MRNWTLFLVLFPFLLRAGTTDGSILLFNDSPFILTAVIEARDGSFLGQFTIQPGQQRNFTTNMYPTRFVSPGAPDISLTPYIVVWQCASEELYSLCQSVSPGAMSQASACAGVHYCLTKKEEKKQPSSSTIKKTK